MAFLMKCRMSKVRTFEGYSPVTRLRLMHSKHISKYDILSSDTFKKSSDTNGYNQKPDPNYYCTLVRFQKRVLINSRSSYDKKSNFTWVRKYL